MAKVPSVPLLGTPNTPLSELLAWHGELLTADREHATNTAAIAASLERRRIAFKQFLRLICIHGDDQKAARAAAASGDTSIAVDKGKGKERAPLAEGDDVSDGDAEMSHAEEEEED
jgi:hypothetical protein